MRLLAEANALNLLESTRPCPRVGFVDVGLLSTGVDLIGELFGLPGGACK